MSSRTAPRTAGFQPAVAQVFNLPPASRRPWFPSFRPLLLAALLPVALALAVSAADSGVPVGPPRNRYASDEWKLPTDVPTVKPGAGAEPVIANCTLCHSLDYIVTQPVLTRAQWTAGVEKMRTRFGAPVATNQVAGIVEYLTSNYGKP